MSNTLKLMYVLVTPVVLVLFYDHVVVPNWSSWLIQYPSLANVPQWVVLAVMVIVYAVNVWMLVGADWLREFRRDRMGNL